MNYWPEALQQPATSNQQPATAFGRFFYGRHDRTRTGLFVML
jgi:hypothetical protein